MEKFKSIINSDQDLSRFKTIIKTQKSRILEDHYEYVNKKIVSQAMVIKKRAPGRSDTLIGGMQEEDNLMSGKSKYQDYSRLTYLPSTFEGMMEQFGINLQRKNLYGEFHENVNQIA